MLQLEVSTPSCSGSPGLNFQQGAVILSLFWFSVAPRSQCWAKTLRKVHGCFLLSTNITSVGTEDDSHIRIKTKCRWNCNCVPRYYSHTVIIAYALLNAVVPLESWASITTDVHSALFFVLYLHLATLGPHKSFSSSSGHFTVGFPTFLTPSGSL